MTSKTLISGKDLALEDTIDNATRFLAAMGIETEPVSWFNPVPDCWSVHLQCTGCPALYTNGKGTSRLAGLASGLGEFLERLASNVFFADYFLANAAENLPFYFYPDELWFSPGKGGSVPAKNCQGVALLNKKLRAFYDPEGELSAAHLVDNNIDSDGAEICALPFRSLTSKVTTYFPVSLLNNLYVSNGTAAGNSAAECCSQALSEIIERYVKNIVIARGISLPDVPYAHLQKYPRLCGILDTLAKQKLSIQVKDASLGGQFPVICVLVADPDSGGVFAAFGANCRFAVAVERTLTELLQGRGLEQFRGFQPPCHHLELVADPFNLESHFVDSDGLLAWHMFHHTADFPYCPWDFSGSTEQELRHLQQLIKSRGFAVYYAEYLHCGMYSCRMLVPGMSEIYPVDDLLWNNKNTGAALRPLLLRLQQMDEKGLSELFELLETLGLGDEQLIPHLIGVLFDQPSPWATLRIGELKAMLLLALGRKEEALGWCSWCIDYGALPQTRMRLYKLLQTLLNFVGMGEKISDFEVTLQLFYTTKELQEALLLINGASRFPGLYFANTWTEISSAHRDLLQLYGRINRMKTPAVA